MDKKERELKKIMSDPVLWAEKHIGEKPRWYQEQILRHPHNRIVLRMGRRLGKCIAGDQRILNTQTGEYESIQSLYEQKKTIPLASLEGDYTIGERESLVIQDNGLKDVFDVETRQGAIVRLTGNHPVLTIEGWKEVDMLELGESIATPKGLPYFGDTSVSEEHARVMGYLTAGYDETKFGPVLSLGVDEARKKVIDVIKKANLTMSKKGAKTYYVFSEGSRYEELLKNELEAVPKEVFTYDKEALSYFLTSLYDVSGWAYAKRVPELALSSYSHEYVKLVKHLLLRFNISANITRRKGSGRDYYHLIINTKNDIEMFYEEIGQHGFRDYSEVVALANQMSGKKDMLPIEVWPMIEKEQKEKGLKNYEVTGDRAKKFRRNAGINLDNALIYAENLESSELYDLALSGVRWEEVVKITPAGETQTYDVSVPETHNLVVEDVLVHNTWTMAVHMLWVVFTGMGGKIQDRGAIAVVATPYDNQAKLIFDEIRRFIDSSETLQNSVASITKNPYYIEFKNGGKIKLFTAGTRSGAGGASLRGQAADN